MGSPWGGKKVTALPWHSGDDDPSVYTHKVGTLDSRSIAALLQLQACRSVDCKM